MRLPLMLILDDPSIEEPLAFLHRFEMQHQAGCRPLSFLAIPANKLLLSRVRVRISIIIINNFFTFFFILCFGYPSARHRRIIGAGIGAPCRVSTLVTLIVADS